MNNNNKSIITKLLVFVCLILLGIVLSQFLGVKKSVKKKPVEGIDQVILSFAKKQADIYAKGDINELYLKGKLNCPQYLEDSMPVHSSFFECNPLYFLCRTKAVEKFKNYNFQFLGYEVGKKANLIVKYIVQGRAFQIKLKDTCTSTYLPRNVYNAGPLENKKFLWDNNLQDVYIDKNYFSHLDLALSEQRKLENIQDVYQPVLNLSKKEMQKACAQKGGQLLQNRYFDAAVNFPSKVVDKLVRKFPYPWTKRRELRDEPLKARCLKNYSSDCLKFPYIYHSDYSPSWIGIYHSLGSFMEFLDNKLFPAANLKISSYLIKDQNLWNKNFLRASISEDMSIKEFNNIEREYLGKKEWAFRCMYLK